MSLSEVVFHLSAIASTAAIAKTFFNGSRFGYHPTFLALGFVFLMGEGIVFAIKAKVPIFFLLHLLLLYSNSILLKFHLITHREKNVKENFGSILYFKCLQQWLFLVECMQFILIK